MSDYLFSLLQSDVFLYLELTRKKIDFSGVLLLLLLAINVLLFECVYVHA